MKIGYWIATVVSLMWSLVAVLDRWLYRLERWRAARKGIT